MTHAGNSGYGLQWKTATPISAGTSLSGFKFTTTTTPAELAGSATFFDHPLVGTSFVYSGAPFSDAGLQFVINPVPEPMSFVAIAAGIAVFRQRRKV